jgi:hypothetical protein
MEFKVTGTHTHSDTMMRIIELTPPQIVALFGWFNLKPYLRWDDIEKCDTMTFRSLIDAGLTPTQLHLIQPDIQSWKQHASITLDDCIDMIQWPAHPIHVMKADLADIISMRWTPNQMACLGINVDGLILLGMIPDLMSLFVFTLSAWVTIGLTQKHVENMTDAEIIRVFRMSRMQVLCSTSTPPTPNIVDTHITSTSVDISNDETTQSHGHLIRPVNQKQ